MGECNVMRANRIVLSVFYLYMYWSSNCYVYVSSYYVILLNFIFCDYRIFSYCYLSNHVPFYVDCF